MLTSLIRALRGPYQVRVSFAWGTRAVPIGGFEEISVVCCFTATLGKWWPTLLEHTEVMGSWAFMPSDTSGTSSRIMISVVTQTLKTSVALKKHLTLTGTPHYISKLSYLFSHFRFCISFVPVISLNTLFLPHFYLRKSSRNKSVRGDFRVAWKYLHGQDKMLLYTLLPRPLSFN